MRNYQQMEQLVRAQMAPRPGINSPAQKESEMFESLLGDIKDAIVAKVKEKATGWIMNLVGMGPGPDPLDAIKDQLKKQYDELKVIESKIDALSTALEQAVEVLKNEIDIDKYHTSVTVLDLSVSKITAKYERLMFYANTTPSPSQKADIEDLAKEIKSTIPDAFIAIKNALLGTAAGNENIISLFTRIAFKGSRSLEEYAQTIHTQFMYYYGLQVKALALITEAYHFDGNVAMAKQYFNTYVGQMNEEIKLYLKFAPKCILRNTLPLPSTPACIVAQGKNIYVATSATEAGGGAAQLVTVRGSDVQILNTQAVADADTCWTILEKDGMAYLISAAGMASWNIDKVKLGDNPVRQARLKYEAPGQGYFRLAFVTGCDIEGDYLYIMFLPFAERVGVIKVIDLRTFTFADNREIRIADDFQSLGSLANNGMKVKGGKIYFHAWFAADHFHSLKVMDANTKKIEQTLKLEPNNGQGGRSPIVIDGDRLYCACDDTQLRVADLTKQPLKLMLHEWVGANMNNMFVDGNLVYFTTVLDGDTRGQLRIAYWTSRAGVLHKGMNVGGGIGPMYMDATHMYAGGGGGDKVLYELTCVQDLTHNIIPVDPVASNEVLQEAAEEETVA